MLKIYPWYEFESYWSKIYRSWGQWVDIIYCILTDYAGLSVIWIMVIAKITCHSIITAVLLLGKLSKYLKCLSFHYSSFLAFLSFLLFEFANYVTYAYFVVMFTSLNGNIFRLTGHLCGELIHRSPVNSRTKAGDAELWCCLWSHLNKRLSKQWWGWWFETPSRPLWRNCNGNIQIQ